MEEKQVRVRVKTQRAAQTICMVTMTTRVDMKCTMLTLSRDSSAMPMIKPARMPMRHTAVLRPRVGI